MMEVELSSDSPVTGFDHTYNDASQKPNWNGRTVSIDYCSFNAPKIQLCSSVGGYFDPEKKKAQEFEINVLLHAIHSQSQKEYDDKFIKLQSHVNGIMQSTATLVIAIFARDFVSSILATSALVFLVHEKVLLTMAEFQKLMKERGVDYEDVFFCTLAEDYIKNQQELKAKELILQPSDRHYTENPHYTDNPHYTKPLYPNNFKTWIFGGAKAPQFADHK
jgi:hypothetical protein